MSIIEHDFGKKKRQSKLDLAIDDLLKASERTGLVEIGANISVAVRKRFLGDRIDKIEGQFDAGVRDKEAGALTRFLRHADLLDYDRFKLNRS